MFLLCLVVASNMEVEILILLINLSGSLGITGLYSVKKEGLSSGRMCS